MNISVKADYALHAIFDLALQRPGEPVRIAGIARRQRIPQKFLELILSGLKQGGFVESRRGADGGYLLARPANSITIGEVIRFMEGSKAARNGSNPRAQGPFTLLWATVDAAVSDVVDQTTFGDLALKWRERQGTYVPNWDI